MFYVLSKEKLGVDNWLGLKLLRGYARHRRGISAHPNGFKIATSSLMFVYITDVYH